MSKADKRKLAARGASERLDELRRAAQAFTPARLFTGRSGPAYKTEDLLQLRTDHAQARDAVERPFEPEKLLDAAQTKEWSPLFVQTLAETKDEYLVRPDRGRAFGKSDAKRIASECPAESQLQVIIGDGLSVAAIEDQAPGLLDSLRREAHAAGWRLGRLVIVRHCRVGILNHVGDLIRPEVAVLLIGERPGLAVANSLGAYMAYRPCAGRTDADRNVLSNIHAHGIGADDAARRIITLANEMRRRGKSGVEVKEPAGGLGDDSHSYIDTKRTTKIEERREKVRMKIQGVIFDLAGTTIIDGGSVMAAFRGAIESEKIEYDREYLLATMGQSKTRVLTEVARQGGVAESEIVAFVERTHERFQKIYIAMCDAGKIKAIDGVPELLTELKRRGLKLATTTGFHRATAEAVVRVLDPDGSIFDASISSDQVAEGRPEPDMIVKACELMGIDDAEGIANLGDTPTDLRSGEAAGVGMNIGVLTGDAEPDALRAAPHTHILDSAVKMTELLDGDSA